MNFSKIDMPNFVNRELKQIQELILPTMKKVSKYTLGSFLLIAISVINLFSLVFIVPSHMSSMFTIGFYALIGAVGMALYKEARLQRKEMKKRSTDYIIERIQKSHLISDQSKEEYISQIKDNP
ncbi:YwnF family protein [Halobacillus shinanisalinarum]|uniref:YwnF family protein n=1 Tax=Halobacillus shinanisalinarum TaxID=2932258 RepID=A0ABY4GWQ7_9BACI|nr:DUF5392 family protein [Halobacillus shinanisalinarum]UOQ92355.1 YwnF family protein [Halobacillus shinanisalinarum]